MSLLELKQLTYETGDRKILNDLLLPIDSSGGHALLATNGTGKSPLPI